MECEKRGFLRDDVLQVISKRRFMNNPASHYIPEKTCQ
jgi:hypothetical protein